MDLRNAGFKLAPVDTNLFPGGFNNLTPEMLPLAVQAAMAAIEKICPEAKNLLLIPEKHTRNTFYLTNVQRLMQIFHQAGLNVRLGTLDAEHQGADRRWRCPTAATLTLEPLVRTRGRLGLKDFDPCTILLNNDLSAGVPEGAGGPARAVPAAAAARRLGGAAQDQPLPELRGGGEEVRQAAGHGPVADQPDVRAAAARSTSADGAGHRLRASNAEALLAKIRRKYKEYGINEKPFVVVKADAGTYGMGIMTVRDAKDLDDARTAARATR